jgi:hypothetical protein
MTTLHPYRDPKSGEIRRVYVRRPGLTARLWFQKSRCSGFDVRFDTTRGDFSVICTPGDAAHVVEARAALADVGLELTRCTWTDIEERSRPRAARAWFAFPILARCLPSLRRLAS